MTEEESKEPQPLIFPENFLSFSFEKLTIDVTQHQFKFLSLEGMYKVFL